MFFINKHKQNGTKLNDLNKEETCNETKNSHFNRVVLLAILIGIASPTVYAENKEQDNHTFTQPFQNKTISLTGTSVRSTMYFTKIDYWDVKKHHSI